MNSKNTLTTLISTMYQDDYSLLDKMNINTNAVVVNQCEREVITKFIYRDHEIVWIDSKDRGLSKSRNLALRNANGTICLLCDDDEVLYKGYETHILKAFDDIEKSDIIVFNINRIGWNEEEKLFERVRKIPKYKTYGSVHLSFRLDSIVNNNISFDTEFGAGSGKYNCAEDALFCLKCHRNKLNMFSYPAVISDVYCEKSSWFSGYNEKYFFDTGAFLSKAYPKIKQLMKWYYPIRCKKLTTLTVSQIIAFIKMGFKGFLLNMSYEEYIKRSDR